MDAVAMRHIETYGWLCEDSLRQAADVEARGDQRAADAYRECARLWSDRAFREAQS